MSTILLAIGSMVVKDAVGVLLVVAESRGRYWTAALFDALSDIATVGVTIYGAGTVLIDGWSAHTFAVLGAMMVTSFAGTAFWTRAATRWMPVVSPEVAVLTSRVSVLEGRRESELSRPDPWN